MHTGLRGKGHNERLQREHCKHTCLLLHLKNHRRILVLRDVTTRQEVPMVNITWHTKTTSPKQPMEFFVNTRRRQKHGKRKLITRMKK